MGDDHIQKPRRQIDTTGLRHALFGNPKATMKGQSTDDPSPGSEARISSGAGLEAPGRDALIPSERLARPTIGYRNPLRETRFKPGQSGNPTGRPKGSGKSKPARKVASASPLASPTLNEIRRRHVATPIRIRDGEGVRELHLIEALMRQVDKLAFEGSIQATRLALKWHEESLLEMEVEHRENEAWVADYLADYPIRAAAFEKTGKAMPDWFPRPEDIHISREKGLRIIGPYTPEGLEHFLLLRRWRDALHVKMIYDEIVFFDRPGVRVTLTIAEFMVFRIDHLMPARWKLASKEMRDREWKLICLPRPQLVQQLKEAFEPLGLKAPIRKPMSPMPAKMLRALEINPKQMKERFAKTEAA